VLWLLVLAAPAAAQEEPDVAALVPGTRVLVVGAPGLRWEDVDPSSTPTLHRLAGRSAVGALSVKALPRVSCPADGWLSLGAGARAQGFDLPCRAPETGDEVPGDLPARNLATRDAADVEALSTTLRESGLCLAARGPGAELAGGDAARACPVMLLDAPAVRGDGSDRAAPASAVDALVGAVDAARSPGSTLLVLGLSGAPGEKQAHLHVALASGPGFEPGALRSPSTRRAPYVQLLDVAPTILGLVGLEPPGAMVGRAWQSTGEPVAIDRLSALDRRAVASQRTLVPFFVVLVGSLLLALALARRRRSWALAELVGLAGVAALSGSYLVGLLPWARSPAPLLVLLLVVAVVAVAGALAARRLAAPVGPLAPAAAATGSLALLLVLDLLTGARLQVDAPAGYSPLVAGRFAGIGNVAFGVLAASSLLALAAATAHLAWRTALVVVGVVGAVVVVVDGAPPFGSDLGGVLALVPAVVLLAMLRAGLRVTASRLLAAGFGGAALVTLFALVDFSRAPADRSHLGRFVEQVRDGSAGVVLRRKAEAIGSLLLANPATALLPLVVAVAVWLVVRPPRPLHKAFAAFPAWRHGLLAVGLVSALGFVLNDSGPAVPAFTLLVAVPATVAVCARAAARRDTLAPGGG
jgi:hypothetical protein